MPSLAPSPFADVQQAARDPILGLTEAFNNDSRPVKVNLGVGVYLTEAGKVPLLQCVHQAEEALAAAALAKNYLPIDGAPVYNKAVRELLFGAESLVVAENKVVTLETLGGTGGLKVGADYLRRLLPQSKVAISDPSWENHRAIFEMAGFDVVSYAYYDPVRRGVDFEAMCASLSSLPQGTVAVLHGCCHNPTGADLEESQWDAVISLCAERGLFPFLDMAYQGFWKGLAEDTLAVRKFADSGLAFMVSNSFSKSLSLYGERVGALSIVTANATEAANVLSQVKRTIRTNYSNPPTHGGAIVASILNSPDLRALWEKELTEMRERIRAMRHELVKGVEALKVKQDFSFVTRQNGMFSYSGLNAKQVESLQTKYGIYALSTGRICVAALNSKNVGYVCEAIADVVSA
jgi:aromatic-amino-acid transaminase